MLTHNTYILLATVARHVSDCCAPIGCTVTAHRPLK